jgi:dCTP deaminase
MFLSHQAIKRLCLAIDLVEPFNERAEFGGVSYGCGPASYDLRIDRDVTLWPGRSVRADAIERIHMPLWLLGLLFSKSTWARTHIEHAGTMVDPGFGWGASGILRLELNMHHGEDVVNLKAGQAVVQILFSPLLEITGDIVENKPPVMTFAFTDCPYGVEDKYQNQPANQDAIFKVSV